MPSQYLLGVAKQVTNTSKSKVPSLVEMYLSIGEAALET
jgi:hypothetical protein